MTNYQKKQLIATTKRRIRETLKDLEEVVVKDIQRAIDSGEIAEDSHFLKDNCLLSSCLIENKIDFITIKHPDYIKESENIKLCI